MSRNQTIKINLLANQLSGQYENPNANAYKKTYLKYGKHTDGAYEMGVVVNECDNIK